MSEELLPVYVVSCGDIACIYAEAVFSTPEEAHAYAKRRSRSGSGETCDVTRYVINDPDSGERLRDESTS